MKKLVAIMGSPHLNGNAATGVNLILEGAVQSGIQCEKIELNNKKINYCIGCRKCIEGDGVCVLRDDMGSMIEAIKNADIVLIAAPIYICQINARTKNFLDRLLPLTDIHHKPRYGIKKLIMLYTYGAPVPFLFRKYIRLNGKSLAAMGLRIKKNVILSGCMKIDSVRSNKRRSKKLLEFGKKL